MDRAVFPFGDGGKIIFVEDDLFQFVRADQRSGFRPHIVEIKGVFLAESRLERNLDAKILNPFLRKILDSK